MMKVWKDAAGLKSKLHSVCYWSVVQMVSQSWESGKWKLHDGKIILKVDV